MPHVACVCAVLCVLRAPCQAHCGLIPRQKAEEARVEPYHSGVPKQTPPGCQSPEQSQWFSTFLM